MNCSLLSNYFLHHTYTFMIIIKQVEYKVHDAIISKDMVLYAWINDIRTYL